MENIDIIYVLDLLVECFCGIPFLRDHKFPPNGMKNEYNMLNYYPQFNGICTIDKCTMDQWITLVISLQAEKNKTCTKTADDETKNRSETTAATRNKNQKICTKLELLQQNRRQMIVLLSFFFFFLNNQYYYFQPKPSRREKWRLKNIIQHSSV